MWIGFSLGSTDVVLVESKRRSYPGSCQFRHMRPFCDAPRGPTAIFRNIGWRPWSRSKRRRGGSGGGERVGGRDVSEDYQCGHLPVTFVSGEGQLIGAEAHRRFSYTMNLAQTTRMVLEELDLTSKDGTPTKKALPWRQSLGLNRREEDVRPVFWKNRNKTYVARTQDWDEFPNGRWGILDRLPSASWMLMASD